MSCFTRKLEIVLREYEEDRSGLDVLYHGTNIANVPSIMKHGLDPLKSCYADDEEANDSDNLGPPYHFVFLSDYESASGFAPGGENNMSPVNERAVLEVRLPQHLQDQLVLDRGEFIRAPFLISPQFIRQVE